MKVTKNKVFFLKGPNPCSDKISQELDHLFIRCEDVQTDNPQDATYIITLGDKEDWPELREEPSPLTPIITWFENFYDQNVYEEIIERFPKVTFLHGPQGLVELTGILEESDIIETLSKSDPLAEDVFFRLKGEYLHQLEDDLRDLLSMTDRKSADFKEEWQKLLLRIAGSAGTYEFEELSAVATETLKLYESKVPSAAEEKAQQSKIKEALDHELDRYTWQAEESLPTQVEIDVRQRVLVLVNDSQIANQLRFALNHSRIETVIYEQPSTILSALHSVQPDILVVQQDMRNFDGLDLAAYVRKMKRFEALPILALLGDASENTLARATRGGVDSWLTIPFSAANVALSVLNLLQRVEVARKLGGRDGLTGLYTKEAMIDRLGGDLLRVARSGQQIAVMLIHIRETDESPRLAFMEVANAANRVFRRSDLLARYNEATLAAILPGIDTRTILTVTSRVRHLLGDSLDVEMVATVGDGNASSEALMADVENRLTRALSGVKEGAIGLYEPEPSQTKRTTPKVLIADTDEAIVNLLRFFCAREGFEVDDVRTGTDTVSYLEKAQEEDGLPQVLVLETFLPGIDGFQILEKVQADYGNRIAVIMLCVSPSEERVSKAFKMGATDFVAKPFRVPEIIARIRNGLVRTCAL